jgi:molybdopterin molybdotransferase
VCFDQYVRPALSRILNRLDEANRGATALLEQALETRPTLHHFVRGKAQFREDATLTVRATGAQDSNLISSIVDANCLIHVPEGMDAPHAGDVVRIEWFRYGC